MPKKKAQPKAPPKWELPDNWDQLSRALKLEDLCARLKSTDYNQLEKMKDQITVEEKQLLIDAISTEFTIDWHRTADIGSLRFSLKQDDPQTEHWISLFLLPDFLIQSWVKKITFYWCEYIDKWAEENWPEDDDLPEDHPDFFPPDIRDIDVQGKMSKWETWMLKHQQLCKKLLLRDDWKEVMKHIGDVTPPPWHLFGNTSNQNKPQRLSRPSLMDTSIATPNNTDLSIDHIFQDHKTPIGTRSAIPKTPKSAARPSILETASVKRNGEAGPARRILNDSDIEEESEEPEEEESSTVEPQSVEPQEESIIDLVQNKRNESMEIESEESESATQEEEEESVTPDSPAVPKNLNTVMKKFGNLELNAIVEDEEEEEEEDSTPEDDTQMVVQEPSQNNIFKKGNRPNQLLNSSDEEESDEEMTTLLTKTTKKYNKPHTHALNTALTPIALDSPSCNSPQVKKSKMSSTPARNQKEPGQGLFNKQNSQGKQVRRSSRISQLQDKSDESVDSLSSRPAAGTVSKLTKKFGASNTVISQSEKEKIKPRTAFSTSKKGTGTTSRVQQAAAVGSSSTLSKKPAGFISKKTSNGKNSSGFGSKNSSSGFIKPSKPSTGPLQVGGSFLKNNTSRNYLNSKNKSKQQLDEEFRAARVKKQEERIEKEKRIKQRQEEEKREAQRKKADALKKRQENAQKRRQEKEAQEESLRQQRDAERQQERQAEQIRQKQAAEKQKKKVAEAKEREHLKAKAQHHAAKENQKLKPQKANQFRPKEQEIVESSSSEDEEREVNSHDVQSPTEYEATFDRPMLPATATDYRIDDLDSGDETDEADAPKKPVPSWAKKENRKKLLDELYSKGLEEGGILKTFSCWAVKTERDLNVTVRDGGGICPLEDIFEKKSSRFNNRTSSAVWHRRPVLKDANF